MLRRIQTLPPWMHRAYGIALVVLVVWATERYGEEYDWVIGWAMALALLWRRRWPMTVLTVICGLALVQYSLAVFPFPSLAGIAAVYDGAALVAMVSVVTHARTMWHTYVAGAAVLLDRFAGKPAPAERHDERLGSLTLREREVLELVAEACPTARSPPASVPNRCAAEPGLRGFPHTARRKAPE
ncbi:hypothetical protein OHB00_08290 [Streptomyces sp. NBC_00631]|uniref:DUF7134 domain-containing protein n=1 Tax=Streptomyces sp. NBC_00631 TaxID=2975793 RepID=UPI0030E4F022